MLNDKNILCELLNLCSNQDFEIMKRIFKERKPCINSGKKIPLINAIIKGNRDFI